MTMPWLAELTGGRKRSRLNRVPSPVLAIAAPWITIMIASLAPALPVVASAPILPPLGFMMLLAWRQIRPGLLPVWAGLPLGMFDDVFSGQPFGSAAFLWSVTMLLYELIEARFPWRSFAIDWLIAAASLAAYILLSAVIAVGGLAPLLILSLGPQLVLAILLFPLTGRVVARADQLRLVPFVEIA